MTNPGPQKIHITASTTLTPFAQTALLNSIYYTCSNAGTTWTFKVQDQDTTPSIIVPQTTFAVSTTLQNPVLAYPTFRQSGLLCVGGLQIIFTGTAGVVDLWIDGLYV